MHENPIEENGKGVVVAVCISDARGTPKRVIARGRLVADHGLEGDAHAGDWHRQVSLLSMDKIRRFNAVGGGARDGDFGENVIVDGIDLAKLPVGTRLRIGETVMEVTQIGKKCHRHCHIFHRIGDCIMPREGIFAKVVQGGWLQRGDPVEIEQPT